MFKSVGLICLLFSVTMAATCGTSLTNTDNVVFSIYFNSQVGSLSYFDVYLSNTVPGMTNPNTVVDRISDVHSFVIGDTNATHASGGSVGKPHGTYPLINGGAAALTTFSIPTSKTGNNKCVGVAFAYTKRGVENYFLGQFELDPSNVLNAREEQVEESEEMAARGCNPCSWVTNAFNGVSAQSTSNPYYFKFGASSYSSVTISYGCVSPSCAGSGFGISFTTPANGQFSGTGPANKNGNFVVTAAQAGDYNTSLTISYTCSGNQGSGSVTGYFNTHIVDQGSKRAISAPIQDVQSAPLQSVLVVASAGVAVAGVAVIVAVVAVVMVARRRSSTFTAI